MRKMIALLACILSICAHGMENNCWSITSYGTRINLIKGDITDAGDRVDAIILGYHQQEKFREFSLARTMEADHIGTMYICESNIYLNSNDYDSDSNDEYPLFTPGGYEVKENFVYLPRKNPIKKKIECQLFMIAEPCIKNLEHEVVSYYKLCDGRHFENRGNEALKEALKDLDICYQKLLNATKNFKTRPIKKISLSILGVEVGVPWDKAGEVGVKAILKFIKNNRGPYDCIELFVKKRFEFSLYKLLLIKQSGLMDNILLMYNAARSDSGTNFALLPRELIGYIAQLI